MQQLHAYMFHAGFHWRELEGYPDGFPVLFENKLPTLRAVQLVQLLTDGNFLDKRVCQRLWRGHMFLGIYQCWHTQPVIVSQTSLVAHAD
jgi:hypothetical protein